MRSGLCALLHRSGHPGRVHYVYRVFEHQTWGGRGGGLHPEEAEEEDPGSEKYLKSRHLNQFLITFLPFLMNFEGKLETLLMKKRLTINSLGRKSLNF